MISVRNLNFAYNGIHVLKGVSFEISRGEFVGILGPNGVGKSTLLKLLNRILIPKTGRIVIAGKLIEKYSRKELARQVGLVPQDFKVAFNFSVMDIVLMGRFPYQKSFAGNSKEDIDIAISVMRETDCEYLRERDFMSLSGGERQRVILASALAQEPDILLLDEPTTALDLKHQVHFYEIIEKLQGDKGITILNVTHDVNLLIQSCNRFIVLKDGHILADGPSDKVIKKDVLQNVYDTSLDLTHHPESGLPVVLPEYNKSKFNKRNV